MDEPKRGLFNDIQFRDILYALSLVTVGLLFVFQRQSEVKELSGNVVNMQKIQSELVISVTAHQKLIDSITSELRIQSERNLEQDKRIGEAQSQLITLIPMVVEIKTKLNFVADLMDQRMKEKR